MLRLTVLRFLVDPPSDRWPSISYHSNLMQASGDDEFLWIAIR